MCDKLASNEKGPRTGRETKGVPFLSSSSPASGVMTGAHFTSAMLNSRKRRAQIWRAHTAHPVNGTL